MYDGVTSHHFQEQSQLFFQILCQLKNNLDKLSRVSSEVIVMHRRIRGHYRIGPSGQLELLADVNAAAKPFSAPQMRRNRRGKDHSGLNGKSLAGIGVFMLGIGMLFEMPQIERGMLYAQSAAGAFAHTQRDSFPQQDRFDHLPQSPAVPPADHVQVADGVNPDEKSGNGSV
jgi:hypothetical protein